jgi:hypothetical protein
MSQHRTSWGLLVLGPQNSLLLAGSEVMDIQCDPLPPQLQSEGVKDPGAK